MTSSLRCAAAGLVLGLTGTVLSTTPSSAVLTAPSSEVAAVSRTTLAARWQGGELRRGRIPSAFVKGADWGLTVDTLYALVADGTQKQRIRRTGKAIRHHITDYTTFGDSVSSGATAKILLAAVVLRADPRHFGGMNVRRSLLRMMAGPRAGFEHGRFRDKGDTDFSNTFGQSYGVIGLSRSGDVPQAAVRYLLKQRCRAGYFRTVPTKGKTCTQAGSAADVDATALALQAMLAAKHRGDAAVAGKAIKKTARWLVRRQRDNGAFGGGTGTKGVNANSTALAAQALKAAGRDKAARKAARWVKRLQITRAKADGEKARDEIGAVAYNRKALRDALEDGITKATRDQFRRTTAQAVLGLARIPFGALRVRR